MLLGETIHSGAPRVCSICKIKLKLEVLYSPAGYYIGTQCNCGPYSRESHYYETRESVEKALNDDNINYRE
jgi:hypothetical protein